MTDLEKTILACAKALATASVDDVEAATWAVGDDQMAEGESLETILDGIRFAKRMQIRTDAGGTIMHVAWAGGAQVTLEAEGKETFQDLVRDLVGGGEKSPKPEGADQ